MAEINTLPLAVPLLFLVVLKLCDIAREIDLKKTQGNAPWDVIMGFESRWTRNLPSLGRFIFIHATNFFLLFVAFIFTLFNLEGGNTRKMLLVFVALVWALLPIFEVQEYDDIPPRTDGDWPSSFQHHFFFVFFITTSILIMNAMGKIILTLDFIPEYIFSTIGPLMMMGILLSLCASGVERFLIRLDREISDANLNSEE